jgi:hypothetical protein
MSKKTIYSILTVSVVSLTGSVGLTLLTGKAIAGYFLALTALQVLVGYVANVFIVEKFKHEAFLAELEKLESLSTILNCAYCEEPNVKSFVPNDDANFVCTKCNNENTVVVQFSVARTTTPVNSILSEPQKNHNIKL